MKICSNVAQSISIGIKFTNSFCNFIYIFQNLLTHSCITMESRDIKIMIIGADLTQGRAVLNHLIELRDKNANRHHWKLATILPANERELVEMSRKNKVEVFEGDITRKSFLMEAFKVSKSLIFSRMMINTF
jgi:hypothetical protein